MVKTTRKMLRWQFSYLTVRISQTTSHQLEWSHQRFSRSVQKNLWHDFIKIVSRPIVEIVQRSLQLMLNGIIVMANNFALVIYIRGSHMIFYGMNNWKLKFVGELFHVEIIRACKLFKRWTCFDIRERFMVHKVSSW